MTRWTAAGGSWLVRVPALVLIGALFAAVAGGSESGGGSTDLATELMADTCVTVDGSELPIQIQDWDEQVLDVDDVKGWWDEVEEELDLDWKFDEDDLTPHQLIEYYVDWGAVENNVGAAGDVAFAQAILQSGWFANEHSTEYYNFAGVPVNGAFGQYDTPAEGVEAHFDFLQDYLRSEWATTWDEVGERWSDSHDGPSYWAEFAPIYQSMVDFAAEDEGSCADEADDDDAGSASDADADEAGGEGDEGEAESEEGTEDETDADEDAADDDEDGSGGAGDEDDTDEDDTDTDDGGAGDEEVDEEPDLDADAAFGSVTRDIGDYRMPRPSSWYHEDRLTGDQWFETSSGSLDVWVPLNGIHGVTAITSGEVTDASRCSEGEGLAIEVEDEARYTYCGVRFSSRTLWGNLNIGDHVDAGDSFAVLAESGRRDDGTGFHLSIEEKDDTGEWIAVCPAKLLVALADGGTPVATLSEEGDYMDPTVGRLPAAPCEE